MSGGASDENVFTVIDEDSRTERFRIDNSGNITASGTLSASGYNASNWDTAYSWGNHASAGYLTSSYLLDYTLGSYRVISDYGGNSTWYIRSNGQFIWGTGHDWTASFRLNIDNGSGYASNGSWAYFGQQDSNSGKGTWRGVRIRNMMVARLTVIYLLEHST